MSWAAKHGIGIVDIVENRVVGMKSRASTRLRRHHSHGSPQAAGGADSDRATMEMKEKIGNKLAQVVYEGKWYTPSAML